MGKDNITFINGIPFGFTESAFEMPGDYGMDDEIPDSNFPDMTGWPEHAKTQLMALEAKETVLEYMKLRPERWTAEIARLTTEAGALRSGMSFEYLSGYDNIIDGDKKKLMFTK